MNRFTATPTEFSRLMDWLEPVHPDRRPAIARMLFAELGTCPMCARTVRRCDGRRRVGDRLYHVACAEDGAP